MLLVLLGQLHTEQCVRQFRLLWPYLPNIVQQASAPGQLSVQAQLRGHGGAEIGDLSAVLQQVLPIRGAEPHAAHQLYQLRVKSIHTEVNDGALAQLYYLLLDVLLCLGDHLLDTGGVDATIRHQAV